MQCLEDNTSGDDALGDDAARVVLYVAPPLEGVGRSWNHCTIPDSGSGYGSHGNPIVATSGISAHGEQAGELVANSLIIMWLSMFLMGIYMVFNGALYPTMP